MDTEGVPGLHTFVVREQRMPRNYTGLGLARQVLRLPGMDISTKTSQDAFTRVVQARIGSLAGQPTAEYLEKLEQQLHLWLQDVHAEVLAVRAREIAAAAAAEDAKCDDETCEHCGLKAETCENRRNGTICPEYSDADESDENWMCEQCGEPAADCHKAFLARVRK